MPKGKWWNDKNGTGPSYSWCVRRKSSRIGDTLSGNKRTVFGLAFSILKDYSLAEDIVHDVFNKIRIYTHRYHPWEKGMMWILGITHNLSYKYLKKIENMVLVIDEIFICKYEGKWFRWRYYLIRGNISIN